MTEWMQLAVFIAAMYGMVSSLKTDVAANRAESIAMSAHLDAKMDAMQRHTECMIEAIRQDIKDFHGRLCAIEERRIGEK